MLERTFPAVELPIVHPAEAARNNRADAKAEYEQDQTEDYPLSPLHLTLCYACFEPALDIE